MRPESMNIGMRVRHPGYGSGEVIALNRTTCEILFDDGQKRMVSPDGSGLEPIEATVEITGLSTPLDRLIRQVAGGVIEKLGIERPAGSADGILPKWKGGTLSLVPEKPDLQPKEVPIETFFHKIVMVRDQLRVLEQKINSHKGLEESEKVELQQYITRCYGSLTTFNVLFREKEDQFGK